MKALIYLLFITSTTLSLLSQRIPEQPIEILKPSNYFETDAIFTTDRTITGSHCYGNGSFCRSPYKSTITSMDVDAFYTFGILTPESEPRYYQSSLASFCELPSLRRLQDPEFKEEIDVIIIDESSESPIDLTHYTFHDTKHYVGGGLSLITITPCDIKHIPYVAGKIDVVEGLMNDKLVSYNEFFHEGETLEDLSIQLAETPIRGCGEKEVVELEPLIQQQNDIAESDQSAQGPITGLEGHNFTEEPAIIYPNPVMDIINVKSTDPITVIEILNLHGETIQTFRINETMDVSHLAAGTYFARIHFENIKDIQIEQILIVK